QVEDALRYGNRLIVLDAGQIVADFDQTKSSIEACRCLSLFQLSECEKGRQICL
ncbi:ABC transporter ATPase, partial [Lacticaseibacillus rhamnosus MTCC 5462]